MSIKLEILSLLGDGRFHSGQALGNALGVSRAAVWKAIRSLCQQYDLVIQSVPGRGYRLPQPVELLDTDQIMAGISLASRKFLTGIEIIPVVDSTNEYLQQLVSQGTPSGYVVLAEQQTAGRGRRGHQWVSPFGANIYLSMAWRFNSSAHELSGLGIAVATSLARSLAKFAAGLGVKWPNDILWKEQKLAGILLEIQGEANGPAAVIIGVGVNVNMPTDIGHSIDQAWVDLARIQQDHVSRQQVAAHVIDGLLEAMHDYQTRGFDPVRQGWSEWDLLDGKLLNIKMENQTITGTGRGIDEHGAILVECDGKLERFLAGDVSLRRQE